MSRVTLAGLIALPTFLLLTPAASAQCSGPGCGAAGPAAGPGCLAPRVVTNPFANCSHLGCGAFCFHFFSHLHQDGPLFNYGPYYGYYPFEPYGPWTADLRYNAPPLDCGGCGRCGHCRAKLGGWLHHKDGGCGGWGAYAKATLANVCHRINPFGHKCHGCGDAVAATADPAGTAVAGGGTPPAADGVQQAGYPRRER